MNSGGQCLVEGGGKALDQFLGKQVFSNDVASFGELRMH
jgi:hypothetical protein